MAGKEKIDEMISGMSPSLKKELLNELVASLLKEVSEEDKKQVPGLGLSLRAAVRNSGPELGAGGIYLAVPIEEDWTWRTRR